MTETSQQKLTGLRNSYATPWQAIYIINTAIMPSIAYAFPVTPCDPDRLNDWDNKIGCLIKHKFKFMKSTPTAMIRESKDDFGLGCHSISVEYHRRNAKALIHSMNHKSQRHKCITEKLLRN
jgi:hypothetical protein